MLDALFNPKSIAVIGASNRPLTIGYRITQNLKDIGFKGPIYPVHPKNPEINQLKAYPSILQVPGEVDLAHIVVKNTLVPMVMEECGKKGVKAVIINTAGFKEIGGDGIELEKKVVEIGKKYNVRIFGPNCQGVMNSEETNPVYANFTFTRIKPGYISILAQSGGVGEIVNQRLSELGVGIRMYASNGNAADISIPEILAWWGKDDKTRVIILHIESLANPQEFMKVAREVTRHKPILGMKTGRTSLGARAVSSHTGSLMKADTAVEVVFDKCGIISFRNQEDICQAAIGFAAQPIPQGPNVGIITNTGGPGIIATDECIEAGLAIPDISEETKKYLKANLFPEATVSNPVDVLATAGPKEYAAAIEALLRDPRIDSVMINFVTPFFVDCVGVAREMARIGSQRGLTSLPKKPLLGVIMTDKKNWAETLQIIKQAGIPAYDLPETASMALAAMTKYGAYQKRPKEEPVVFKDVKQSEAQQIIANARKSGREFLSAGEAIGLLEAYQIPVAKFGIAETPEDILKTAKYVGYPLALKIDSPDAVHKTEKGGVILGINTEEQLTKGLKNLQGKFSGHEVQYVLQEYLAGGAERSPDEHRGGKEIIIGANYVEGIGHLIMFGLGGILVEVLKDVAFKIAPLTKYEAEEMMQSVKGYQILKGVRGAKGVNIDKLTEIILRLSQLLADCPDIKELDLNPVMAYTEANKTKVVDVRVKI